MKNTYKILCRNPQGKRPLGRHTCRWDNIKLGQREIGCEVMGWIQLVQDRVSFCEYIDELRFHKSGEFLDHLSNYQLFKKYSAIWS
jgi:hypothetical protein